MGCLNQKNAQYVEQQQTYTAIAARTVFELTGLESGGIDEQWIVATAMPICKPH